MHAHRLAHRAAQVGARPPGRGCGAAGAAPGRGEPDRAHDPAQRGQLLGGAGGERLVPQDRRRRRPSARGGPPPRRRSSPSARSPGPRSTAWASAPRRGGDSGSRRCAGPPRRGRSGGTPGRRPGSARGGSPSACARPSRGRRGRSGSSVAIARAVGHDVAGADASPAARSSWPKATSSSTNESPGPTVRHRTTISLEVVAHEVEVVALLDTAPRVSSAAAGVEVVSPSTSRVCHPVERLGDTRRLGQVELAEPVARPTTIAGQRLGDAGRADQDDLHLALGARVADPVVEAAPLERVVQLPGPVGGQDHQGRRARRRWCRSRGW